MKQSAIVLLSFFSFSTSAQVNIQDNITASGLVQKLVGSGIVYTNPVLNCPSGASGTFTTVTSNLGLDSGIILTSGRALTTGTATGANGDQSLTASNSNQGPGDPDLTTLANNNTNDACILEFDFVPDGDSLIFDYVFGSEEYDAFSCTGFNDVFAFFLSGPGLTGTQNVALVPGTNIPVAINSTTNPAITNPTSLIDCHAMGTGSPFAQYYVDNSTGGTVTYYGFTTILQARAKVIPCTTYHIKLAIADAGDFILDSGVFLAANSFRSTNITLAMESVLNGKYDYLVEGCTQGQITAKRPEPYSYPQTIHLAYGGTATRDLDYFNAVDSVTIPANDTIAQFTIQPIPFDGIKEGTETIVIYTLNPCNKNVMDSFTIKVEDYLPSNLISDDTALCQGDPLPLQMDGDVDFTWTWRSNPRSYIVDSTKVNTVAYPDTSTEYIVSATYQGCYTDTSRFKARVEPIPIVNIIPSDTSVCLANAIDIPVTLGPSWFTDYRVIWSPDDGRLDNVKELRPSFYTTDLGNFKYTLTATTPLGCKNSDSVTITPYPPLEITKKEDTRIYYGDEVQLWADGALYYTWFPSNVLNNGTIANPIAKPKENTTFTVYAVNEYGCMDTAEVKIIIDYTMNTFIPSAFSPNNDGRNDIFHVVNLRHQRLIEFRVFNRWGQEVFATVDPNKGWDGTFKGVPQEMGVYNYIIRLAYPDGENKMFKGTVTLVR